MKDSKEPFTKVIIFYFVILLLTGILDITNLDSFLFKLILNQSKDLPFWTIVEITTLVGSLLIAYIAILNSNENVSKQLKIEQTPYVVINESISSQELALEYKNIGRGMAKRITISPTKDTDENKRKVLLNGKEPHSIDLGSNEKSKQITIDNQHLEGLNTPEALTLYIYYFDQLNKSYITQVNFHKETFGYKVMENKLLKSI